VPAPRYDLPASIASAATEPASAGQRPRRLRALRRPRTTSRLRAADAAPSRRTADPAMAATGSSPESWTASGLMAATMAGCRYGKRRRRRPRSGPPDGGEAPRARVASQDARPGSGIGRARHEVQADSVRAGTERRENPLRVRDAADLDEGSRASAATSCGTDPAATKLGPPWPARPSHESLADEGSVDPDASSRPAIGAR